MRERFIKLVKNNRVIGTDGFASTPTSEITECWAKRSDATRTEVYAAAAVGLKPEATFEVSSIDYHGQDQLIDEDDIKYRVIRSFQRDRSDTVSLTVERW